MVDGSGAAGDGVLEHLFARDGVPVEVHLVRAREREVGEVLAVVGDRRARGAGGSGRRRRRRRGELVRVREAAVLLARALVAERKRRSDDAR
jgi:hypothetical protein